MGEVGSWIRAADTKATVLSAATGILLGGLATRADTITKALHHHGATRYWLLAPSAVLTVVALVATVMALFGVLTPRTNASSALNHFAWPSLSAQARASVPDQEHDLSSEAWEQAYDLSKIAKAKYDAFKCSLRWFSALALAAAVTIGSAAWIIGGAA